MIAPTGTTWSVVRATTLPPFGTRSQTYRPPVGLRTSRGRSRASPTYDRAATLRASIVEVGLIDADGIVPGGAAVLLALQHVVTVLGVVALEGGGKEVVDLRVGHVQASAFVFRELDGDRLRAPVEVDVPTVRMTRDALVVGGV